MDVRPVVVGTAENGRTFKVLAKDGVILTTGGFSANIDMRVQYDTIWDQKDWEGRHDDQCAVDYR